MNKQMKIRNILKDIENINLSKIEDASKLTIIGITGSRGKSSTAYIIYKYLKRKGIKAILYSSIGIFSYNTIYKANEAVENPMRSMEMVKNALKEACEARAKVLILEVNEEAINKGITKDIPMDIRVITNIWAKQNDILYPDYVNIKKKFFREASSDTKFIMSLTDKDLVDLYKELNYDKKITTFTSEYLKEARGVDFDVDYIIKSNHDKFDSIKGITFILKKGEEEIVIDSNLLMPYSSFNITCAYSVISELKLMDDSIFKEVIKDIKIPGRDEVIDVSEYEKIIVSLNLVPQLEILKKYKERGEIGKIIVVTGSTGLGFASWDSGHDMQTLTKDKREAVSFAFKYILNNADYLIITTSDRGDILNPFIELEKEIVEGKMEYMMCLDRKEAIKKAIDITNDEGKMNVTFVSGRGNRNVMCLEKGKITLFNDKEVIKKLIGVKKNGKKN
ncbi:MAG: Mur ligase family protein [Coprobacillus sp.]|nr:Mur ligase family protein [Coprobacillus sp.]